MATNASSRYSSTARASGTVPAGSAPAGTEVAEDGLRRGHTTATMTKRIARMAAMMTTPESVTKRAASRSARNRRLSGRAAALRAGGATGSPGDALSSVEDMASASYLRSLASSSCSIFDGRGK